MMGGGVGHQRGQTMGGDMLGGVINSESNIPAPKNSINPGHQLISDQVANDFGGGFGGNLNRNFAQSNQVIPCQKTNQNVPLFNQPMSKNLNMIVPSPIEAQTMISGEDGKVYGHSSDSYSMEESEHGQVSLTEYAKKIMRKKMKIDISHNKAYEHLKNGTSETIDFTGHGIFLIKQK